MSLMQTNPQRTALYYTPRIKIRLSSVYYGFENFSGQIAAFLHLSLDDLRVD